MGIAYPQCHLQNHPHEYHGLLRVPASLFLLRGIPLQYISQTAGQQPTEGNSTLVLADLPVAATITDIHCCLQFPRPCGDFHSDENDFRTPIQGGGPPRTGQPLQGLLPPPCGLPGILGSSAMRLAVTRPVVLAAVYPALAATLPPLLRTHVCLNPY